VRGGEGFKRSHRVRTSGGVVAIVQVVFLLFSVLFVLPMVGVAGVTRSLRYSGVFALAGAVAAAL
jgi:hypothetical protein